MGSIALRRLATILLSLIVGSWAVPYGTAHSFAQRKTQARSVRTGEIQSRLSIPRPVSFRDVPGRGLLVKAWVNSVGPFNFAVDTGAGATLLAPHIASEAHVVIKGNHGDTIAGLSGISVSAHEARIATLAIGDNENILPAKGLELVTTGLPSGVDGVLDPTEAFAPLGFVIDVERGELSAFDPHDTPVKMSDQPPDGAVVQWLRDGHTRRPFVMLDSGDKALLDTGSNLGFAIRENNLSKSDRNGQGYIIRDVGGGSVSARRVAPATIAIGSLTLRKIPTDVVSGAEADAPVLLGLSALRPFRLRFDPLHHLIEIAPSRQRS